MITDTSIFTIPEHVEAAIVDDDLVLLNFETGDFYGVGSVGTEVFSMLEEENKLGPILERLKTEYDVPEETLRQDLIALFNALQENNLLEITHG